MFSHRQADKQADRQTDRQTDSYLQGDVDVLLPVDAGDLLDALQSLLRPPVQNQPAG